MVLLAAALAWVLVETPREAQIGVIDLSEDH